MTSLNGKRVLMVIAPKDFKDEEYYIPKGILESSGATVITCSTLNEATSVDGKKQKADILLEEADANYDAVVFVGGPGARGYFDNEDAINLARNFYNTGKIVAAICAAPGILANAGLLDGKKATGFPSVEELLKSKGADYTGSSVEIDGKIITGKDPNAAEEFGNKIVENLS